MGTAPQPVSPLSKVDVLLGPPGTGKTSTLIKKIEGLLSNGVKPNEIAFVSYTRAATYNARDKMSDQFGIPPSDFPYFRTIHSMALAAMGQHFNVMTSEDWKDFGEAFHYEFSNDDSIDTIFNFEHDGDCIKSTDAIARVTMETIDKAMLRVSEIPFYITPQMITDYRRRLSEWKKDNRKIDFTDMLEYALQANWKPPVKYAFIDESQDSNRIQNALTNHWFIENDICQKVTFAGDDDQQIYGWSGAQYGFLQNLARSCPTEILSHSWRVPSSAHAVAQQIIRQNRDRVLKTYTPRDGDPGHVHTAVNTEDAITMLGEGNTFILVRSNKMAAQVREACLKAGVMFSAVTGEKSPLERKEPRGAFSAVQAWRDSRQASASDFRSLIELMPVSVTENGKKNTILPRGLKTKACKTNLDPVPLWRARDEFKMPNDTLATFLGDHPFELVQANLSGEDRAWMTKILLADPMMRGPMITISTIHKSKGLERPNVIIRPDLPRPTVRAMNSSHQGFEEENCVAYVAATRTLGTLVILNPSQRDSYPYPMVKP